MLSMPTIMTIQAVTQETYILAWSREQYQEVPQPFLSVGERTVKTNLMISATTLLAPYSVAMSATAEASGDTRCSKCCSSWITFRLVPATQRHPDQSLSLGTGSKRKLRHCSWEACRQCWH